MLSRISIVYSRLSWLLCLALSSLCGNAGAAEPLTLARAEQLALAHAPWYAHHHTNVDAANERAAYVGQLPDPQILLGALNLPSDSLRQGQIDMTMLMVGVRQQFPPGDTLALRSKRAHAELDQETWHLEHERRTLLRDVRSLWLEVYFLEQSRRTVSALRPLYQSAVRANEGRYRAGVARLQEVLNARLAFTRIDDRDQALRADLVRARAQLARRLGVAADDPLPETLPPLPSMEQPFDAGDHPEMHVASAGLATAQIDVDLARQQYKPGFMLELSYGARQDRQDLVSAVVTMDMPIFTRNRQDRRVAEQVSAENGARLAIDDKRYELEAQYRATRAELDALSERLRFYENAMLPDARRAAEVTVSGFARDQNELRDARVNDLETRLNYERLRVDYAKAQTQLLYLTGEPQP
jgi:outer membrane protein TolC